MGDGLYVSLADALAGLGIMVSVILAIAAWNMWFWRYMVAQLTAMGDRVTALAMGGLKIEDVREVLRAELDAALRGVPRGT